ncbi:hypothetical protein [Streptomyces coeruleorubidus]|uniref:hypothetical protein n=1 Tax=Streptomyces coeruleorubidus TaxID=116188 RepID=UPI0036777607
MCALPARRIASSALCAALLVGITGPVAMAADSARGHAHVAPGARLPGADARLAQIAQLNWGEQLTPVADLLNAVLDSNGPLPAAEARKLGAEAKAALVEAAAKDARTPVTPTVVLLPAPAPPALVPAVSERRAADPVTDLLDLVLGAVDSLLQAITSGVGGILPSVDGLLNGVDDLLAGLIGGNLTPQAEPVSSTPSSTSSTSASTTPEAVTYPAVTLLPPAQPTAS